MLVQTNPVSPTPSEGDLYYSDVLNQYMYYDSSRSKWLSVSVYVEGNGRNGNTTAGSFYRRYNGKILSASDGGATTAGTITFIAFTCSTAVTHTYEVLVNGVLISSLASGGAAAAGDATLNDDFPLGIMSARNAAGSATTNGLQATIHYRLRV